MDKCVRIRDAGYEGYGLVDGDTVFETASLFSTERGKAHKFAGVKLLAPCQPSKIVCVGRNYADHAKEFNNPLPAEPIIFLKPPSAIIATEEAIVYPPLSSLVSYEGELGVVIGQRARHVKASDAWEVIFGFTCVNDVTARDLQKKDGQWTRGKGFDTFCPFGPWIVRKEDLTFDQLRVRTRVDGEVRQDAPVTDMIFPVNVIIEYVTRFMTLEPGDLIATGTPSGVGGVEPGSTVSVEVEGVGVLRNHIVRG